MDFSDLVDTPATDPNQPPQGQPQVRPPPKPYWQTLDEYRKAAAQEPEIAKMSVPEYASGINQLVGYPEHQENIQDNALRRGGANIEIGLKHFGGHTAGEDPISAKLPSLSELVGGPPEGVDLPAAAHRGAAGLATQMGASPGVSEAVGKGGEQLVESMPAMIAGTLPGVGIPAMGAVAGLQTYGETGSKLQAGVSGVGTALIPKFMEGAGQTALKAIGAKTLGELKPELANLLPKDTAATTEQLAKFTPSSLVERGAEFGAKQLGLTANMLGTQAAETTVDPTMSWEDKLKNIGSEFSPSNLVATGIGQLPFTALDLIRARTHPLDIAKSDIRADAADRITKAAQAGVPATEGAPAEPGFTPSPKQVSDIVDHLETGKKVPVDTKMGKVLESIGLPPVQSDFKTPLHTSEGEWKPLEAFESVRAKANDMLLAQGKADPDKPPITEADNPIISTVLRGINAETLSKDDLAHLAASQITDKWTGDRDSLRQSGYVPDADEAPRFGVGTYNRKTGWANRFSSYQQQAATEEKITALTDPNSKLYDPNVAMRMALVSGSQEDRISAQGAGLLPEERRNLTGDIMTQHWQAIKQAVSEVAPELQVTKETAVNKPMLTNIIDLVSGLGPKRAEREAAIYKQIDEEIAQHGILASEFGGRGELERLRGELNRIAASKWERSGMEKGSPTVTGRENVGAPSGDATFYARKRALEYDKPFDPNDPKSVADFVRDISATIRQAEDQYNRRPLGEPATRDEAGEIRKFVTKAQAEEWANDANSKRTGQDQYNLKYTVPALPEKDGTFRVLEKRFASLFGLVENKGEAETPEGLMPEEDTTEKPLTDTGVLPEGTSFDALSEAANFFGKRVTDLSKHNDPAVVQGRIAAMVNNFSDGMQAIPDATFREIWKAATGSRVQDVDKWKKRFIRYVQFLGYQGDVVVKQEKGRLRGVGNLDDLNRFMQELGYGKLKPPHKQAGQEDISKWNRVEKGQSVNFFEKFALVSNYISKFTVDPRTLRPDPEYRPLGDYGWQSPEFRRDLPNRVDVKWDDIPKSDVTHFRPGVLNRDGSEYRSDLAGVTDKTGTIAVNTGQPLADLLIKAAQHDLTLKAKDMVKWFKQLGGVDTAMAEMLMQKLPFVANQNVGVGMTKDFLNRGYFHTAGGIESAGVLIDPFMYNGQTGKFDLMHPKDVFPILMEELGHSSVDFAWDTNKGFQDDVQRAYDHVKGRLDDLVKLGAAGEKFAQLGMTSLRSPREMLAGMFKDPGLHEFLKGIDDPEPFYQSGVRRNFFDKLYNMIKDLFTKLVGPVGANTMLSRVAGLTARAVEIQQGMPLVNRGDVYQELYQRGLLSMGEISSLKRQPVPKPVEPTQVYPQHTPTDISTIRPPQPGPTGEIDPKAAYLWEAVLNAQKELRGTETTQVGIEAKRDVQTRIDTIKELYRQYMSGQSEGIEPPKGWKPSFKPGQYQYEEPGKLPTDIQPVRRMLEEDVAREQLRLSAARSDDYTNTPELAKQRLEYAQNRLATYDRGELSVTDLVDSSAVKDRESYVADLQAKLVHTQGLQLSDPRAREQQIETIQRLTGEIQKNNRLISVLNELKGKEEGTFPVGQKGTVIESRTDPSRVIDAMKASSVYLTEDNVGDLWFKPYNVGQFRDVFGPAFGDKLRFTNVNGQWGYSIKPSEAFNLTQGDVARMPIPRVKPWAPSIFETMKGLFKQQGANDATAEALAGYNMQFAATLKNSDRGIWGTLPSEGSKDLGYTLGRAWGYLKQVGITKEAVNKAPEVTVRHESAHIAGFHDLYAHETPDVKKSVELVNSMFEGLSQDQKVALTDTLTNLTNFDRKTFRAPYEAATTNPFEFAADIMGHVGDMITEVPKPSAYLREAMRFAPDEISNLLQLKTLRATQGLERLAHVLEQTERSRGLKTGMFQVVKDVSEVFNDMSRSSLEIAEDQSEFYRTRMVYPDTYKSLLEKVADRQQTIMEGSKAAGYTEATPSLKSELLESRLPPTIENMIRKFFNYPTSDGNLPTKLPLWDKNMMQLPQFALKYPVARSHTDMLTHSEAMRNNFRQVMQVSLAGAFEGNKLMDDVRTKHVSDFYKSVPMRSMLSKMALELNVLGDFKYNQEKKAANNDEFMMDPTKVTDWITPQYMQSLMTKHGVTDKERPAIQTVLDGLRNQYNAANLAIVDSHTHALETMLARGVARATDKQPEESRAIMQFLSDAVQKQTTDPQGAAESLGQFQQAIVDPANPASQAVFQKLLDAAQGGFREIERLKLAMSMRSPYFFSEIRPGKFGLVWQDAKGKVDNRYFASDKDRRDYITRNNIDPKRQTNPDQGIGISPNIMSMIDDIQKSTVDRARSLFGDDEAEQLGKLSDFSTDLRDSLNRNDLLRESLGRRLQPGRDELDLFDTSQHYLNAVSNVIKSRFIRNEKDLLFTSHDFDNQPEIKQYLEGQIQAMLRPDTPTGSFLRNAAFFYYLWGNPSSMIMQTSHQVMGLAPMLTRMGESVAGSFNMIRKANQAVIDARKSGFKDPVLQEMVSRLEKDGGVTSWLNKEVDYNEDLSLVNRIRGTSGKSLWEPFDLAKNKLYQALNLGRRLYSIIPDYNTKVGFVAALMHLRGRSAEFGGPLSGDQLYKEARFMQQNTMYTGGKAGRPGFFQWMPRSAAQGLWSLQTYANGLTTEMGELIRRSFNPKGMTSAQTRQVRKAAAQMLITQTAVAGVLGLPFATLTLTALQKLFPEHNIEGDIREALASLAGDDDAMGSFVSNAATMGIPSAMDYSPDLGSRFALHGVFHVSPYGDIGWEQMMGPAGGILTNVLKGAQAGLEGRPMETVQSLMPVGFRRVWQALEQGQTYKTQSGRTMADDLGPAEVVARSIGFRPSRVRRIEDFERLNKITETAAAEEQASWTKKQVENLKAGNDSGVRQNIAQRVADKKGVYPAQRLATDVAEEYEKQTTPVDLRKFGNRATVEAQRGLQGTLGTQSEGPSNTDRLRIQQEIAARLGMGGPSRARWNHAAGVDQLLQRYPHLTTPQASLLLNHAAGSRPSQDLYQELLTSGE